MLTTEEAEYLAEARVAATLASVSMRGRTEPETSLRRTAATAHGPMPPPQDRHVLTANGRALPCCIAHSRTAATALTLGDATSSAARDLERCAYRGFARRAFRDAREVLRHCGLRWSCDSHEPRERVTITPSGPRLCHHPCLDEEERSRRRRAVRRHRVAEVIVVDGGSKDRRQSGPRPPVPGECGTAPRVRPGHAFGIAASKPRAKSLFIDGDGSDGRRITAFCTHPDRTPFRPRLAACGERRARQLSVARSCRPAVGFLIRLAYGCGSPTCRHSGPFAGRRWNASACAKRASAESRNADARPAAGLRIVEVPSAAPPAGGVSKGGRSLVAARSPGCSPGPSCDRMDPSREARRAAIERAMRPSRRKSRTAAG